MHYAVIMAGGAGKRLWPLSRMSRPKQLLSLIEGKSLMEMAVERLQGLFANENILIVTNAEYAESIAAVLPNIPRENIIGEPEGRDTSNAIALATAILLAKDPNATMAVFTADHVIRPVECFQMAVSKAIKAAEADPQALLTFGIRPTWPHTGLGYVHCGKTLADGLHEVEGFKEKPDHQTARRYVEDKKHYWNSGMFVWKLSAISQALTLYLPDSVKKLAAVTQAIKSGKPYAEVLATVYPTLQRISIDFAVMEKAAKVLMVELSCEWLDVGSWPSLENVCKLDEGGNAVVATNAVLLDSYRNIVVTEDNHLLAVLGMDECIIVHSPDATLVCNKSDSQRIKELAALLEQKYGRKFL